MNEGALDTFHLRPLCQDIRTTAEHRHVTRNNHCLDPSPHPVGNLGLQIVIEPFRATLFVNGKYIRVRLVHRIRFFGAKLDTGESLPIVVPEVEELHQIIMGIGPSISEHLNGSVGSKDNS